MKNWYIESAEDTLSAFSSNAETGLDSTQIQQNRSSFGKNRLRENERKSFLSHFLSHLKGITTVVLIISAFVFLVSEIVEAHGRPVNFAEPFTIIAIVILHALFSAVQETKSEDYLNKLSKINAPFSKVRRDGTVQIIPSEDIVPGDIVLLEAGNLVPADGRLISCSSLVCDESIITGVRTPTQKNADAHIDVTCPISDRVNMVYSGCIAVSGSGEYVVTATGMHTEVGSMAGILANEEKDKTALQRQLSQLGKVLGTASLIICAVLFLYCASVTKDWLRALLTAVSLAYTAVPGGLTAIVAVILALGVHRMAKMGAMVKKLSAVETLSGASVICSDNTGVLTLDKMSLQRAWSYEDNALRNIRDLSPADDSSIVRLIQLAALCSDAVIESGENGVVTETGDPTDAAVISALMELGQNKSELDKAYSLVSEIPFDSERKLMTRVFSTNSGVISITKGSPEIILSRCHGVDMPLVTAVCDSMSKDAMRVLAVACKRLPKIPSKDDGDIEKRLTFIGLIGLKAIQRDDAFSAIRTCREAGIRTVMLTGDDIGAASAMAYEMGVLSEGEEAISGNELEKMSDSEFCTNVRKYSVYSRITPADRTRIVRAWQDAGETAVMTGSLVTDAPALKAADVGCAMGIAGTDAAKGAADLILKDDNFASVVSSVRQGRGIFRNITKTVRYLLSCSLGTTAAIVLCMLFLKALPVEAVHIMLINLVVTTLPALALGLEPADSDLMHIKPTARGEGLLSRNSIIETCIHSLMIGILTVIAYAAGLALSGKDAVSASSMAFAVLVFSQLTLALTVRTGSTVFSKAFISNRIMLYAQLGSLAVILSIMFIPPFMNVFSLSYLSGKMWLWVILLAFVPVLILEAIKLGERMYGKYTVQSFE